MTKLPLPVHTDIIGREISIGDYVSAWSVRKPMICRVVSITPKMVKLRRLSTNTSEFLRYGKEVTLLPINDVTFHILQKSG